MYYALNNSQKTPSILNGRLLWNTYMHMEGMEGSFQLKECWNLLQDWSKTLVPKCNKLSFCTVLNAAIIFMETNNVWNMYNCTYRFVYVKMWVTDSHIIQHWKFIKDKETVIILYTNNQGHIKAKDEGSSLLECYTMFIGKHLPKFERIVVPYSTKSSSPRQPINTV